MRKKGDFVSRSAGTDPQGIIEEEKEASSFLFFFYGCIVAVPAKRLIYVSLTENYQFAAFGKSV